MITAGSTYSFIASQSPSGVSSVTFNNIPQGYTDLVIVVSGSCASNDTSIGLLFNGDTGSSYSRTNLQGNGSSASSAVYNNQTTLEMGLINNAGIGTTTVHVLNYSNTNMYKTALGLGAMTDIIREYAGLWRSFNAISSVTVNTWPNNYNFSSGSVVSVYGIKAADTASITPTKAFGGDLIVTDGTYTYHVFKNTGVFNTSPAITADLLVVAGGGGGGKDQSGGGGAGGVLAFASQSLAASTAYTVTVGAGGSGTSTSTGVQGGSSQFGAVTPASVGGGYGGGYSTAGGSGGSGGGSGTGSSTAGTATSGQGNNGTASAGFGGGGGGGAGGLGTSGGSTGGGNGGAGVNTVTNWGSLSAVFSLINVGPNGYIAGGGGGGSEATHANGTGGSGGGGNGGLYSPTTAATSGQPSTGSGGGGGAQSTAGASGGSGIVIVRYLS